ncbi:MAG: TonB-dependent siderophore receptor [Pseudoxanthomonas sp.]
MSALLRMHERRIPMESPVFPFAGFSFRHHALRVLPLALLIAGALVLPPAAAAQDQDQDQQEKKKHDDKATTLDTVKVTTQANTAASTATRLPVEALETPFTIVSLSRDVIENSAATSLTEVLRYAATVGGEEYYGNSSELFYSRGFLLDTGYNFFRDGLRYRKFSSVPLYDVDRIEVLRGPASVIYGALEPGGVINIVSKVPQSEPEQNFRVSTGSYGYQQYTTDLTGPISESVRYRVQGMYSDGGSFRDLVDKRSFGGTATFDFDLGPDTLLTTRVSYYRDKHTADQGIVRTIQSDGSVDIANISRSTYLGEPYTYIHFRELDLSASLRHRISDNWNLRLDVEHSEQEEDRVYVIAEDGNTAVPLSGDFERREGQWNSRLKGTLGRAELAGDFDWGPTRHKLLLGTEAERFKNNHTHYQWDIDSINIYNPVYTWVRPSRSYDDAVYSSPYGQLQSSQSAYLQDLIEFGAHAVLLTGVRYDHVRDKNTLEDSIRYDRDAFTPQLGLVLRPTPDISPYISYTQSFKANEGEDANGNGFAPERGEQLEAGVKWNLPSAKTLFTLAAYQIDKKNVLIYDDASNPDVGRVGGKQRSRGAELSVDTAFSPNLRLGLNWAYIAEAEYLKDTDYTGNRLPNVPRNALGLWSDYTLPGDLYRWKLNLGATYTGITYSTSNNYYTLPAYFLADIGVRYEINDHITLAANIKNLFDRTYYTSSYYNSTMVVPGDPRTLVFTASFSH